MSPAEYRHHPAISCSQAKHGVVSGEKLRYALTAPPAPPSAAMSLGTALHALILEPERYAAATALQPPVNPVTGAPYGVETKRFVSWYADNPDYLPRDDLAERMAATMPDRVQEMLTGGVAESSVFCDYPGVPPGLKCRPDYLTPSAIIDIKTIADVDDIHRAIRRYNYPFQAAWYSLVTFLSDLRSREFDFAFVESAPPHRWRTVSLDTCAQRAGIEQVHLVLDRIARSDYGDPQHITIGT